MKKVEILRPPRTLAEMEADCDGDKTLLKLFHAMQDFMYRYVETVMEYNRILSQGISDEQVNEALLEMEPKRTRIHNGMMDAMNIFSRNLAKAGGDNSWIAGLDGQRAKYARLAMQCVYENETRLGDPAVPAAA